MLYFYTKKNLIWFFRSTEIQFIDFYNQVEIVRRRKKSIIHIINVINFLYLLLLLLFVWIENNTTKQKWKRKRRKCTQWASVLLLFLNSVCFSICIFSSLFDGLNGRTYSRVSTHTVTILHTKEHSNMWTLHNSYP